jgi:DNA-binding transcriptional ArsR family regulator
MFALRAALVRTIENDLTDQRHDLFTRAGLGHLAGRLYALLREHSALTIDSAARLLGVSPRHTTTILSRLRRHRVVIRHAQGWAMSRRDLRTQAARVLGVAGVLEARRALYRAERVVWEWWLAEYATMTSTPRQRPRRPHVLSRPLFEASAQGERVWPRYPRLSDGRANHREARGYVDEGVLYPENRWQLSVA